MATIISTETASTEWSPIPAKEVAAVYDNDSQLLYLWATGNFSSPILAKFQRDEEWVGGLKFNLIATFVPGKLGPEAEGYVADKFEMIQSEHFPNNVVLVEAANGRREVPVVVVGTVSTN